MREWWGGRGGIYLFLNRDWVIWCRAGGLRGGVFRSWWWERRGVEGEEVRGRKRGVGGLCGLSKLFYFFFLGSQKYIYIGEALAKSFKVGGARRSWWSGGKKDAPRCEVSGSVIGRSKGGPELEFWPILCGGPRARFEQRAR